MSRPLDAEATAALKSIVPRLATYGSSVMTYMHEFVSKDAMNQAMNCANPTDRDNVVIGQITTFEGLTALYKTLGKIKAEHVAVILHPFVDESDHLPMLRHIPSRRPKGIDQVLAELAVMKRPDESEKLVMPPHNHIDYFRVNVVGITEAFLPHWNQLYPHFKEMFMLSSNIVQQIDNTTDYYTKIGLFMSRINSSSRYHTQLLIDVLRLFSFPPVIGK